MKPFRWSDLWLPTWSPWEVAVRAAIIYLGLHLFLRLTGRKELSRYSAFDTAVLFLVTVALRKSIVGPDESITSALVALGTMLGLEWLLSYLSYRSSRFADLLSGKVRQLIKAGALQRQQMSAARISEDELRSRLREYGLESLEAVKDAYLERSGKLTFVFWRPDAGVHPAAANG
jgi:uncharacterized membrane protein YcaP (DUF421 family)